MIPRSGFLDVMVPRALRGALKRGPVYDLVRPRLERFVVHDWRRKGCPLPPPHLVKEAIVREYQRTFGLDVFVETGTFLGDMVASMRTDFKKLYTIELDTTLHERASRRFARFPHIAVIQGDSGVVLPELLGGIQRPCLFWLDGHYSGGATARGTDDSPVLRELNHIFNHRVEDHVILIDDARCFTGRDGYPTIEKLQDHVKANRSQWQMHIEDDIIRIHGSAPTLRP